VTIRYVDFCSREKLACAWTEDKTIILCLQDSALVVQPEDFCTLFSSTIEALVCQAFTVSDTCQNMLWHYKFSYDSDLLENPDTPLASSDIVGVFCPDCMTTWVEEQRGQDVTVMTLEDGSQRLVNEHGCEFPLVVTGMTDIEVEDTESINLTIIGNPQTLSADVNISEDADNALTSHSDGLYAAPPSNVNGLFFGDGSDGNRTVTSLDELLTFPARNYHFDNLTINAASSLHPYGCYDTNNPSNFATLEFFQIFVKGTLTINGTISADGGDASGQTAGGTDGSGFTIQDGPGGGNDNGGTGANAGASGTSPGNARGSQGGFMGGGLGGASGAGGAGGAAYTPSLTLNGNFYKCSQILSTLMSFSSYASYTAAAIGGGCGGAGGGGGANGGGTGGKGGGGGGAGGSIYIAAKDIVIGAAGKISAKGGNGGNGTAGVGGNASGGGGGGGGGGGLVYLMYETLTNAGTIDVAGGTAGTGGAAVGSGTAGGNGVNGASGHVYKLNVKLGLFE